MPLVLCHSGRRDALALLSNAFFSADLLLRVAAHLYSRERLAELLADGVAWLDFLSLNVFLLSEGVPRWRRGLLALSSLSCLRFIRVLRNIPSFRLVFGTIAESIRLSSPALASFMSVFAMVVLVYSAVFYQLEPEAFGSFGNALWYTLVTSTTVGFGDYCVRTGAAKAATSSLVVLMMALIPFPSILISMNFAICWDRGAQPCEGRKASQLSRIQEKLAEIQEICKEPI